MEFTQSEQWIWVSASDEDDSDPEVGGSHGNALLEAERIRASPPFAQVDSVGGNGLME